MPCPNNQSLTELLPSMSSVSVQTVTRSSVRQLDKISIIRIFMAANPETKAAIKEIVKNPARLINNFLFLRKRRMAIRIELKNANHEILELLSHNR